VLLPPDRATEQPDRGEEEHGQRCTRQTGELLDRAEVADGRGPHHGVPVAALAFHPEHRLAERLDAEREDEVRADALPQLRAGQRPVEERPPDDHEDGVEPERALPRGGAAPRRLRREGEERRGRKDPCDEPRRRPPVVVDEDAPLVEDILVRPHAEGAVRLVDAFLQHLEAGRRPEVSECGSARNGYRAVGDRLVALVTSVTLVALVAFVGRHRTWLARAAPARVPRHDAPRLRQALPHQHVLDRTAPTSCLAMMRWTSRFGW